MREGQSRELSQQLHLRHTQAGRRALQAERAGGSEALRGRACRIQDPEIGSPVPVTQGRMVAAEVEMEASGWVMPGLWDAVRSLDVSQEELDPVEGLFAEEWGAAERCHLSAEITGRAGGSVAGG